MQQWQIDNAAYIYKYFTSRGFTPESTCGMLGNFTWESGLNPNRFEIGEGYVPWSSNCGVGIAQWTNKVASIRDWCKSHGYSTYQFVDIGNPGLALKIQCEYLYYQMTNPTGQYSIETYTIYTPYGRIYPLTQEEYRLSRASAEYLALVFCANYEKPQPACYGGKPNFSARQFYANYWYSQLASGHIPSSQPAPVPAPSPVNTSPSYDGSYYPPASPDGRYQIQNGNTLSGIAAHFGVTVQELCQWNGIENPNVIYAGHYIYVIPHNPAPHPAGGIVIHVEKGDTLWGIAQRYGVTVQDLCDWNRDKITNPNRIYPGETLVIYPGSVSTSSSPDCITYTVQKGDTLWGIAQRYGVTVQDLCDWNRGVIINPSEIYPNTVIRV